MEFGPLRLIVSPERVAGSLLIRQDARVHAGLFTGDERADLEVARGRRIYLHVAGGELTANGTPLEAGDSLLVSDDGTLTLSGAGEAEVLGFDLPGEAGRDLGPVHDGRYGRGQYRVPIFVRDEHQPGSRPAS